MRIPETAEWLGAFKGNDHSWLDCELILAENLSGPLAELAWRNQNTIWFDYVRLHPVRALYFFCHCYGNAYGAYLGANINHDLRWSRGIKGDAIKSREIKQFVAIKGEADKLGIPYPFWLSHLFVYFAMNGWTRPPRPAHLSSNVEAKEFAHLAWMKQTEGYTIYSNDPWFSVDEWVGHPQQQRYEAWVIDNIKARRQKEYGISYCLYERQHLRIERALQEFGEDEIVAAQSWYKVAVIK